MKQQAQQVEPSSEERMNDILLRIGDQINPPTKADGQFLYDRIGRLYRTTRKVGRQRVALRQLNRAYRAAMMEGRWLRGTLTGDSRYGQANWDIVVKLAKATLWSLFRSELNVGRETPTLTEETQLVLTCNGCGGRVGKDRKPGERHHTEDQWGVAGPLCAGTLVWMPVGHVSGR